MFRNPADQLISASILSSDAGISSMPSSMISNISERESQQQQQQFQFHGKMKFHHQNNPMKIQNLDSGPYSLPTPDVLHAEHASPEMRPEFQKIRQRSQEKGMASKRADLLSENPIKPNTNVGSKLKEMLAEKSNAVNPKKCRDKPKGKWDAIMSQISENKIKSKNSEQPKLKEIKSKVFADFKPPPKLIRHQSINGSSKKISSDKRSLPSRSNSTLSFNGGRGCVIDNIINYRGSSNLPSRSNSSNGGSGAGGCVENVINSRSNLPSRSNSSNGGAGLLEPRYFFKHIMNLIRNSKSVNTGHDTKTPSIIITVLQCLIMITFYA